ncbi:MAG: hypothetical protein J5I41_01415 [Saprospiraceae bacterium]|nr:hypothetical protein [Saprospiraceae bacterium]
MKSISLWAYSHPISSWTLIVLIHIALNTLSGYLGISGGVQGLEVPDFSINLLFAFFIIILLLAPIRRSRFKFWKTSYLKERTFIGLMALTGLAFSYVWNYQMTTDILHAESQKAIALPTALISHPPANSSTRPSYWDMIKLHGIVGGNMHYYRSIVHDFKHKIDSATPSVDKSLQRKKGIIIAMMIVLFFGLLVLSCAIGCSSSNSALLGFLVMGSIIIPIIIGILWYRHEKLKRSSNYSPQSNKPSNE